MKWEELHGSLERGERLLFHSDGLTEARNANENEFGDAYVDDDRRLEPRRLGIDTRRDARRRMEPLHRRQCRPRTTSRLR